GELVQQGATSFLIDLRNNPGGSGEGAIALLSAWIPANQPLFAHRSREGTSAPTTSIANHWPSQPPVALLINGRTASAGELVAAVAQDYGVARVFGETSKGCFARVDFVPLSDGSVLGVTGALVVTSKGRSLNGVGVTPDVVMDYPSDSLMRGEDPQ